MPRDLGVDHLARCPTCDQPISSGICLRCDAAAASRLVRRQILILSFLVVLSAALFLLTRDVATHVRETKARDAASAFERGQQRLEAGATEEAAVAFRTASAGDPDNLRYSLALADTLATAGQNDEARGLLLRTRETGPENAQINMRLARLEAAAGHVSEAVRYYRNALHGIWADGQENAQRRLRVELIGFLLEHEDRQGALSEILILRKNVPADVPSYVQVGRLFLDAGAVGDAVETFEKALALEPTSGEALAGTGEAAFELADYTRARRLLRAAVAQGVGRPRVAERLEISTLVLATDPMAPRLAAAERQRRLQTGLDQVLRRLEGCLDSGADRDELGPLLDEASELKAGLRPNSVRRNPDLPEAGLDLIGRVETAAARSCLGTTPLDRALALIAQRHGVDRP